MGNNVPAPSPTYRGPANRHGGKGNKPINYLVLHCTVTSCCNSATAVADYFRRTSRPASAHYVSDAHRDYQVLWDSLIGFHAPPNSNSLGFEMCCTLSNEGKGHWRGKGHRKMMRRTAKLVAQAALHYDVPIRKLSPAELRAGKRGIVGHDDVRDAWGQTNHWDPGPHFPWQQFLNMCREEADKLREQFDPRPKADKPKPTDKPGKHKREDLPKTRILKANWHTWKAGRHLAEADDLYAQAIKGGRGKHAKRTHEDIKGVREALAETRRNRTIF